MKLISKKKCEKRYLYHSSSLNLKVLDPKYNKKVDGSYEHGKPCVHAFDHVTNEYAFEPVGGYKKMLDSGVCWAHHKIKLKDRILFLGTKLKGYIYIVDGKDFYEIVREDFENGKWKKAKEYVSFKKIKPIKKIKVGGAVDVENISEYEYLGEKYVGVISSKKYLGLCKSAKVKNVIRKAMKKKFISWGSKELEVGVGMKIKKIHIVGIYGSGKSTLAKRLGNIFGYKVYDLDEIKYKRKYDNVRSVKERLKIVKDISKKNSWITEGAWLDYATDLYKSADLVVFLEIPKRVLYRRILFRFFKRKFHKEKYISNNLRSTKNILLKVDKYFHDPKHFMTLESHRNYIKDHAKKVFIIKNGKDLGVLMEMLK